MEKQQWIQLANSPDPKERLAALKLMDKSPEHFRDEVLFWFFNPYNPVGVGYWLRHLLDPEDLELLKRAELELPIIKPIAEKEKYDQAWLSLASSDQLENRILAQTIILADPETYQWEIMASFNMLYNNHLFFPIMPYEYYPLIKYKRMAFKEVLYLHFALHPARFNPFHSFRLSKKVDTKDRVLQIAILRACAINHISDFALGSFYSRIKNMTSVQGIRYIRSLSSILPPEFFYRIHRM